MKKVILSCLQLTLCVCVRLVFGVRMVGVLDWGKRRFSCVRVGEKILKGGGIEKMGDIKFLKRGESWVKRWVPQKGWAGTPLQTMPETIHPHSFANYAWKSSSPLSTCL